VVEITGGKKEKGSTKARTLGEFLGGEGFDGDPFVVVNQTFNNREMGLVRVSSLDTEFNKSQDGETGVLLKVAANPKNIYVSLGDCLPKLSEKGTFRVEIRYYIPKTNKYVNGFKFAQGEAGVIAGSLTTKTAEWETFSFESATRSENPRLLLYLNLKERVQEPQLTGDSILISQLKISHQSMSAFLVQEFDQEGSQASLNTEADKQTLFALDGKIFSKEKE
jgi:hypothetical protein